MSIVDEIKRKSVNDIVRLIDKIPAIVASIFSVMFALSIVFQLKTLVNGFVLVFLIIFIVLFLTMNEIIKVKMIKRVFNGVKSAIIPFIITFILSIGLSTIGIWFWTNKTSEIKQESNIEKAKKINEIKKSYNIKVLNLKSIVYEDTKEYESLNLNLKFLKSRGTATIKERNKVRDNIYTLQETIQKQRIKYSNKKINEINSLNELMNNDIEIINVNYNNKMEKSTTNNFISYIFITLIIITEFIIIILNKILSEKENKFEEILNSNLAKKFLIERNILESFYLIKNVGDTININNAKYSPANGNNVLQWEDISRMYNTFISLGILYGGELVNNVLTNTIDVEKEIALIRFDNYYNTFLKLKIS